MAFLQEKKLLNNIKVKTKSNNIWYLSSIVFVRFSVIGMCTSTYQNLYLLAAFSGSVPVKQFWRTSVRVYTKNILYNHGKLYSNAVPIFMGYTVRFDPCYSMGWTRTIQYGYDDNGGLSIL